MLNTKGKRRTIELGCISGGFKYKRWLKRGKKEESHQQKIEKEKIKYA